MCLCTECPTGEAQFEEVVNLRNQEFVPYVLNDLVNVMSKNCSGEVSDSHYCY